ncbi:porin [Tabrizicola sp.]|uniref:porin n=1 Tax=Tabrizicola sp. TaxID=2005166 RepID=UPI00286A940E|nr:porin [Tabrizicola sp.]
MKKLLIISAVIAAAAGAAQADVALSGDARMGVTSTDGGKTFAFSSRARVRFTLSSEADSGLKFGAQFRVADASAASKGTSGTVFLDTPKLGKLTMGDAEGAAQAAVTQFVAIGYDETGKLQEFAFLTGGDTSKGIDVLYTYAKGPLSVNLSMGDPGTASGKDDAAIGVSYTTEFWKVAGGYEDNGTNTQTVLSGSYGNGQFEVKAAYGMRDDDADQYVVYGTYIFGLNTVTAFHKKDFADVETNGIGILHDLGTGLALSAGYAKKDNGSDALINVGATMSF